MEVRLREHNQTEEFVEVVQKELQRNASDEHL